MGSEQIQLAKALGIAPEDLECVDLLWFAIGNIERLNAELAELRKDRDRLDWMVAYDGEIRTIFSTGNAYCYAVYKEANGSFNFQYCTYGKTPREAIDNAMKEVK